MFYKNVNKPISNNDLYVGLLKRVFFKKCNVLAYPLGYTASLSAGYCRARPVVACVASISVGFPQVWSIFRFLAYPPSHPPFIFALSPICTLQKSEKCLEWLEKAARKRLLRRLCQRCTNSDQTEKVWQNVLPGLLPWFVLAYEEIISCEKASQNRYAGKIIECIYGPLPFWTKISRFIIPLLLFHFTI